MKTVAILSSHPFHITACELLIELTSFTCHDVNDDSAVYECRPNLLAHVSDIRNLISIRDFDKPSIDEMKKFEFISTNPTVEYQVDGDGTAGKKPFYTPKVRIIFYLYQDATQPFLETFMPILFSMFANALNILFAKSFDEFLSNELAIGLTIVFLIPMLSQSEAFTTKFETTHVYVVWVFLGLMISSTTFVIAHNYARTKNQKALVKCLAIVFSWSSLIIPIRNLFIYLRLRNALARPGPQSNPMIFNGRPGKGDNTKGSDVVMANLAQFFHEDSAQTDKDASARKKNNPELVQNPDIISQDVKHHLKVYHQHGGVAPWVFDKEAKLMRAGVSIEDAGRLNDALEWNPFVDLRHVNTPRKKGTKGARTQPWPK